MIRLSPSKLEGAAMCPCYERDFVASAPHVKSDAADEGILMHEAFETGDMSKLETDEQIAMVEMCIGYVENVKALHGPDLVEYKELRLPAADRSNFPAGIIDRLLVSSKRVDVMDAKFGRVFVTTASENLQLKTYAAKLFVQFLPRHAPGVKEITGHLISPRLNDISTAKFTRGVIEEMTKEIKRIERTVVAPFKEPNPQRPDLCAQCSNIGTCPAIQGTVQKIIPLMNLPVPAAFQVGAVVTNEDRSVAQQLADVLISWGKSVKANNREFVMAGGEIPFHRLTRRSGTARVTSVFDAVKALKDAGLIQADQVPVVSTSLKKIMELASTVSGLDAEAENKIKEVLGELVKPANEIVFLSRSRKKADSVKMLPNVYKDATDESGTNSGSDPVSGGDTAKKVEERDAAQLGGLQAIPLGVGRGAGSY